MDDIKLLTFRCVKNLPNGELILNKIYRVSRVLEKYTEFGKYYLYQVEGCSAYFSSVKYDPYYFPNYFLTKAQRREKIISDILS